MEVGENYIFIGLIGNESDIYWRMADENDIIGSASEFLKGSILELKLINFE